MFALTMDDAKAWGVLFLYMVGGLCTLLGTVFAGLANWKAGRSVIVSTNALTAINAHTASTNERMTELSGKAETAIQQNKEIDGKVDGNLSKMWDVVNKLVEQVGDLSKAATNNPTTSTVVLPPSGAQPPPRSPRATDLAPARPEPPAEKA